MNDKFAIKVLVLNGKKKLEEMANYEKELKLYLVSKSYGVGALESGRVRTVQPGF